MGQGNFHHAGISVDLAENEGASANAFAVQVIDRLVGPPLKLRRLKAVCASNVSQEGSVQPHLPVQRLFKSRHISYLPQRGPYRLAGSQLTVDPEGMLSKR